MKQAELRHIAIRAARSYLRMQGVDPAAADDQAALAALDDLFRLDATLISSIWYDRASEDQIKKFRKEWRTA